MIMAFKFLSKKRIGVGLYEHRELKEYYKEWNESYQVADFVCTYEGNTYMILNGERKDLKLKDCIMPFHIRD